MLPEFRNEPNFDFSQQTTVDRFRETLARVKRESGSKTTRWSSAAKQIWLDDVFPSVNPARPDEIIGQFANGTASHAEQAVENSAQAFETWRYTPAADRVRYLLRASAAMRRKRYEFCAMMVLEAGKSWAEADGDVCEAIDFMEYYARQMLRIADSSAALNDSPGEQLDLEYVPLGVCAVIPPWNFPDAILSGLVAAALVAGNTVVLKPAEQTPYTGYKVAELFWDVGLPAGVLNFVTGPGEVVGACMVEHPKTRVIAFTGSREVGVGIFEKASKSLPGQPWLKRTVLEMGGKNAVIVDETADLDAAAAGIVAGAFGFQGQKCSAGSRAIVVDTVYDALAEKVVALAKAIQSGPTDDSPDVYLGPVIDPEAVAKINHYLEIGPQEGTVLLGGTTLDDLDKGYFFGPTIYGEVSPNARIAQEEIFGPVLALIRAKDYDEALADRQRDRIRPDRRGLQQRPGAAGAGTARVSCGQPVL